MRRNLFLKICVGIGATLMAPIHLMAKMARAGKGILVKSGKDRFDKPQILFGSDTFYNKVSTKDTDGDLFILSRQE